MISFLHSFGKFVFKNPKNISSWKNWSQIPRWASFKCHTATVSRPLGVNFFNLRPDPFRFLRAGRLNVFRATDLWTQTWGDFISEQRWDISVQRIFSTTVTLFVCKCVIEEKRIPIHFLGGITWNGREAQWCFSPILPLSQFRCFVGRDQKEK